MSSARLNLCICNGRGILIVLVFIAVILNVDGQEKQSLENRAIFTFQNNHDDGFLTAINVKGPSPPVVTDKWRNAATQKWRAVSAYFYTAYQLKPTSDENRVVSVDTSGDQDFVAQEDAGFGLGNNQYWVINYGGHGFQLLRNLKTDECLSSLGLGKRVGMFPCNNTPKQQWNITML